MLSERSFADCLSTGKVSKRRSTYMDNIDSSCDRRITVMLTVEGRLALLSTLWKRPARPAVKNGERISVRTQLITFSGDSKLISTRCAYSGTAGQQCSRHRCSCVPPGYLVASGMIPTRPLLAHFWIWLVFENPPAIVPSSVPFLTAKVPTPDASDQFRTMFGVRDPDFARRFAMRSDQLPK